MDPTTHPPRPLPNLQALLKNMSKTNPVMLNGVNVSEDGSELKHGDEVVFPQGESERLVFRYELVDADTGEVLGAVKSFGSPSPAKSPAKSPLGERNGEAMEAKSPAKPASAKKATPAKSPAKSPMKAPTPKSAAKSPKAPTPKSAAKSPAKAKTPAGPTPHTKAARELVATAVDNLVNAETKSPAKSPAKSPKKSPMKALTPKSAAKSPVKAPTPKSAAKSPKSAAMSPKSAEPTPHTKAARELVEAAIQSIEKAETTESPAMKSPAKKSPAKKAVGFAASPIKSPLGNKALTSVAAAASPARLSGSPARPALKAPEQRIGAQVPGSVNRRKSLRFANDEVMEQVRIIPAHNGEPEVCGRIAPDEHKDLSGVKRQRSPNRRYSDIAESPAMSADDAPDSVVKANRIGDVGHTGPIPKFTAKSGVSPAKSGSSKKRVSINSPVSTGGSKRQAVSFAIGQAEVTDDVAGTPARKSSGFKKRKGTPAPPSRVSEVDEDEEDEEDEMMAMENDENMEPVEFANVTVEEEGILGSANAMSSIAGTDVNVTADDMAEIGEDDTDDCEIPKFRLGDVGNTGPIPHYSPACKASPSVVAKALGTIHSAGKFGSPVDFGNDSACKSSAKSKRSRRSSQGAMPMATPGTVGRPAAPANTPATGVSQNPAVAALLNLEGYAANIAQTPGGHAKHSAVARILAEEEEMAEAVNCTVEEEVDGAEEFVAAAEAAAAAEFAEAAAEAGAAAAKATEEDEEEDFDFDEAFAMDAALAAEAAEDVEAAVEIEKVLEEVGKAKTPEKVAEWLEANLAEVDAVVDAAVASAAKSSAAKSVMSKSVMSSAAKSTRSRRSSGVRKAMSTPGIGVDAEDAAMLSPVLNDNPLPVNSPFTELVKARGGSAGGRSYGGLSAKMATLHKALRATRAALVKERRRADMFEKLYKETSQHAIDAAEVAEIAAAEVTAAVQAAAAAEKKVDEMMPVKLTISVAKTPVKIIQKAATPLKAATPARPVQLNITVAKTPPVRVVHKTPVKAATPARPVTLSINIAKTPVIVQQAKTPAKAATPARPVQLNINIAKTPKAATPVAAEPAPVAELAAEEEVVCEKVEEEEDACKMCGCADEEQALLCDGCDGSFHMKCLKRKTIPKGDWFCKGCTADRKKAADEAKKAAAAKRKAAEPADGVRRSTRSRR